MYSTIFPLFFVDIYIYIYVFVYLLFIFVIFIFHLLSFQKPGGFKSPLAVLVPESASTFCGIER